MLPVVVSSVVLDVPGVSVVLVVPGTVVAVVVSELVPGGSVVASLEVLCDVTDEADDVDPDEVVGAESVLAPVVVPLPLEPELPSLSVPDEVPPPLQARPMIMKRGRNLGRVMSLLLNDRSRREQSRHLTCCE
jgi:hypothetical protein